jgi:hypothetical protein
MRSSRQNDARRAVRFRRCPYAVKCVSDEKDGDDRNERRRDHLLAAAVGG